MQFARPSPEFVPPVPSPVRVGGEASVMMLLVRRDERDLTNHLSYDGCWAGILDLVRYGAALS